MLRAISISQMSTLLGAPVSNVTATRRSSGDSARPEYRAALTQRAELAAAAIEPGQLPCQVGAGLSVHQRAVRRHGHTDVAALLRADTLGQWKGFAQQLMCFEVEGSRHQGLIVREDQMTGGVRHGRLGLDRA